MSCIICRAKVLNRDGTAPILCRSRACHWTFRTTPADARCKSCMRPLATSQRINGSCADETCLATVAAARRQAKADRRRTSREEFIERSSRVLALAANSGINNPQDYRFARVPGAESALSPLSDERREAYRRHVESLADKVFASIAKGEPIAPHEPEDPSTISVVAEGNLKSACTLCSGYCCTGASTHAFLDAPAIAHYVVKNPGSTPLSVIADYVSRLPALTVSNSCVNHGDHGCALPRSMRSKTCNEHICSGLRELFAATDQAGSANTLFEIGRNDPYTYAIADESGVRTFEVPDLL